MGTLSKPAQGWNPWSIAACCMALVVTVTTLYILTDQHHTVGTLINREGAFTAAGTPRVDCAGMPRNQALRDFVAKASTNSADPLLPQSTSFDDFVVELKASLDRHALPVRSIDWVFAENATVPPNCNGDWMEFGVFTGLSINKTARWRAAHCPKSCPPVFGLDTFTGLAEEWKADDNMVFGKNSFDQGGLFPPVEQNVFLIKGLYSDSLPPFLKQQRIWAEGFRQALKGGSYKPAPLAYLHIDCDLFAGAHDAMTLLSHKIVPGTVIVFDELINYQRYREHELKALWMWLHVSGAKLATIGAKGPIPGHSFTMDADVQRGHAQEHQGAAFVVVSRPGMPAFR